MNFEYTPKFLLRFWSKVDCSAGLFECWIWTAASTQGYGSIVFEGGPRRATRIAYELAYGPFPDNLDVCHTCDNPSCVNPSHLFLGTALDNARDMVQKGRMPHGEQHYKHKLTDDEVAEIRLLWSQGGISQTALAKAFNVDPSHVCDIVNCKKRKRPTKPPSR